MTSIEKTFCVTNFASCETKFEWITQTSSHWQASDSVALEEDRGREEGEDGRAYLFLMMPGLFFFFLHRGRQFVFGENLLSDASFCFSVSQVDASILGPWKCGRGRSSVSVCMCVLERERERGGQKESCGVDLHRDTVSCVLNSGRLLGLCPPFALQTASNPLIDHHGNMAHSQDKAAEGMKRIM